MCNLTFPGCLGRKGRGSGGTAGARVKLPVERNLNTELYDLIGLDFSVIAIIVVVVDVDVGVHNNSVMSFFYS